MGKKKTSILSNYIARNKLNEKDAEDLRSQVSRNDRLLSQKDADETSLKSKNRS